MIMRLGDRRIENQSPHLRHQIRQLNFFRLIHESDIVCRESTRMDQRCFTILCTMLRTRGGLETTQYVDVEEMVAIFFHIVAHDVKNRVARRHFARSGETVSRHFNNSFDALPASIPPQHYLLVFLLPWGHQPGSHYFVNPLVKNI